IIMNKNPPPQPVNGLPTAQTCFFLLRLPPYSSQAILAERLTEAGGRGSTT
uniref:HECT domain-containing protein n=1 Tax=Cynoglossus semilaevis TaxID=244447 RepID=A0A3P8V6W6_CYNSE